MVPVILNPDGTVSETHTANLLLIRGRSAIRPESPHVLPGIMEGAVSDLLSKWGYVLEKRKVKPDSLTGMDQVIITNSLMGAVPALSVDGETLSPPDGLCRRINGVVL